VIRRSFWKNAKPFRQVQQKRNNYVFASAQGVRQRLSERQHGDQILNSTSAGASTTDVYIQRELGNQNFVFEDPDYQVTGVLPAHGAPEVTLGDIDLEKGDAFPGEITRKDSGFPRTGDKSDASKSAGSGDKRSSISRQ
jgi:hypothetical protein